MIQLSNSNSWSLNFLLIFPSYKLFWYFNNSFNLIRSIESYNWLLHDDVILIFLNFYTFAHSMCTNTIKTLQQIVWLISLDGDNASNETQIKDNHMFVQGYHIVIILECICQRIFRNKTIFCTFAKNQIKY